MGSEEIKENDVVDLADAIEALRDTLDRAWERSRGRRVRFRPAPVELAVQVGVTRTAKGAAGLRWQILCLGGERSRQAISTHTLAVQLIPVLTEADGTPLPEDDQLINDVENGNDADRRGNHVLHEPA
jgi:hypothetical protein